MLFIFLINLLQSRLMKVHKNRQKICDGITKIKTNGSNIFISSISDSLFILDKDYQKKSTLQIESGVTDLKINKNILAANSFTNKISIFDIKNLESENKPVEIIAKPCDSWKITLSENNSEIFTGGASGKITKYDTTTGELRGELQVFQEDFMTDLLYTPLNNILMSSNKGKLAFISESFDNLKKVEIELKKNIRSIHKCNDLNKIIIVSDDCKIYFFDLEKQNFICENIFEGHNNLITDLCFKDGESTFFTTSLDGTVKFWDERNGFIDNIFLEEDDQPWGITYVRDNDDIVVGLEDGSILVYDSK